VNGIAAVLVFAVSAQATGAPKDTMNMPTSKVRIARFSEHPQMKHVRGVVAVSFRTSRNVREQTLFPSSMSQATGLPRPANRDVAGCDIITWVVVGRAENSSAAVVCGTIVNKMPQGHPGKLMNLKFPPSVGFLDRRWSCIVI
jgi:hypothetical protein